MKIKRCTRTVWLICLIVGVIAPLPIAAGASVKDFGAVGDGRADDSEAFRKALKAAKGELFVPAGRYLITDVTMPEGITLRGTGVGSVIIKKLEGDFCIFLSSDCTITDLKFTGDPKELVDMHKAILRAYDHCDRTTFRNLTFEKINIGCIKVEHVCFDFRITDCYFTDIANAVHIVFSHRGIISRNIVRNAKKYAMQFWGNWKYKDRNTTGLIFANNYIQNGGHGAIWGAGGRNIVICGNIINGSDDMGINCEFSEDVTITGNMLRNCEPAAIALFFSGKNVSITGNSMVMDHPASRRGIHLTGVNKSLWPDDNGHRFASITGNTMIGVGKKKQGIFVGSAAGPIICAGNVMENATIEDRTGRVKVLGAMAGTDSVADLGRTMTVVPLTQVWQFNIDPQDKGVEEKWFVPDFADDKWAELRSDKDFGWELQGFPGDGASSGYQGYGWYRAELPKVPRPVRKFGYLLFGAVDEQASVYLNGKLVGENTVESTGLSVNDLWTDPFTVDVSKALKLKGENLLAVRVHNRGGMGGIYRPVYLVLSDKPATLTQQSRPVRALTKAKVE